MKDNLRIIPEMELVPIQKRIIGVLVREGLPYNKEPEYFGSNVEEVMCRFHEESSLERWNSRLYVSPSEVLNFKTGLGEIVTNYLTGMTLSGKWIDSDPPYSNIHYDAMSFLNEFALRIARVNTKPAVKGAMDRIMPALAYDYLRPITMDYHASPLSELLRRYWGDKMPRYIPYHIDPLDLLDGVIVNYMLQQVSKRGSQVNTNTSGIGQITGYFDYIEGKIAVLKKDKNTQRQEAIERQDYRRKVHELHHRLSTSTNRESSLDLWMGKVGFSRYLRTS